MFLIHKFFPKRPKAFQNFPKDCKVSCFYQTIYVINQETQATHPSKLLAHAKIKKI